MNKVKYFIGTFAGAATLCVSLVWGMEEILEENFSDEEYDLAERQLQALKLDSFATLQKKEPTRKKVIDDGIVHYLTRYFDNKDKVSQENIDRLNKLTKFTHTDEIFKGKENLHGKPDHWILKKPTDADSPEYKKLENQGILVRTLVIWQWNENKKVLEEFRARIIYRAKKGFYLTKDMNDYNDKLKKINELPKGITLFSLLANRIKDLSLYMK